MSHNVVIWSQYAPPTPPPSADEDAGTKITLVTSSSNSESCLGFRRLQETVLEGVATEFIRTEAVPSLCKHDRKTPKDWVLRATESLNAKANG